MILLTCSTFHKSFHIPLLAVHIFLHCVGKLLPYHKNQQIMLLTFSSGPLPVVDTMLQSVSATLLIDLFYLTIRLSICKWPGLSYIYN